MSLQSTEVNRYVGREFDAHNVVITAVGRRRSTRLHGLDILRTLDYGFGKQETRCEFGVMTGRAHSDRYARSGAPPWRRIAQPYLQRLLSSNPVREGLLLRATYFIDINFETSGGLAAPKRAYGSAVYPSTAACRP